MDRDTEKLKYRKAYQDPDYRMGERRREVLTELLRTLPVGSLVDVGCGRGELLMDAQVMGWETLGLEVVPDLALCQDVELIDGLHELPMEAASVNLAVCADVLEHVTEEDSLAGLEELVRVSSDWVLVTVAWFPHVHRGVELHVNRHPMEWWLEKVLDLQWVTSTRHKEMPGDWGWILAELDG